MDAHTLQDAGIGLSHHFVGKGYTKIFEIKRGSTIGQHAHTKDHYGVLLLGRVVIDTDQARGEISAPMTLNIEAGTAHAISAIEDSLWACVWHDAEGMTTPEEFDAKVTT